MATKSIAMFCVPDLVRVHGGMNVCVAHYRDGHGLLECLVKYNTYLWYGNV